MTRSADIANRVRKALTAGTLTADGTLSGAGGVTVYATPSQLPLSGVSAGSQAYVTASNRLYVHNGTGWYAVSVGAQYQGIPDPGNYVIAVGGAATVNSNVTVPYPSGIESGDLLIIIRWNYSWPITGYVDPAGWDTTYRGAFGGGYWKIADGTETGSVTFKNNSGSGNADASMLRIRMDTGRSIEIKGMKTQYSTGSTSTAPPTTIGNGYDLNIWGGGWNNNGNTYTASSVSTTSGSFTRIVNQSDWSVWYDTDNTNDISWNGTTVQSTIFTVNMVTT